MKKLISIYLLVLLAVTGTTFAQDKTDWKFMHPLPQANLVKKIRMISETEWVACGDQGLFMHSSNSGVNWYFHYAAGRIAATGATPPNYDLWFFDSNTGIVVGDQGYIGRTTNGGITFDSVNTISGGLANLNQRCWNIWFADANTGYIGVGSQTAFTTKILKTTNAGLNWSVVFNDNTGSTSYLVSLGGADDQTVCVAWANGTCLRTTNGGTNWTQQVSAFPAVTNMSSIAFADANTGYAGGTAGKVSLTTNGGANWTSLTPTQTDWSYFQVKVVSPSEVYLIGDPGFLYKSTNQGTSWTSIPITVTGPSVTFIWYSLGFAGSTYVLSGDYGIFAKSTNGGSTWSSNSYQFGSQILSDITTIPGTSKVIAVGRAFPNGSATKQIMRSSNSGANWVASSTGIVGDLQALSMINEFTGYATGTANGVFKTTDGGQSWTQKTGPSPVAGSQLYSMEFADENNGICFVNFSTVAGGNVFKTTNGGDNWAQYTTGAASENIYSSDMVDANTGYCVMNSSGRPVYKTINGGVNWTAIPTAVTGLTGSVHGVSAPDANTVYICQTAGTQRVSKSTNGGANWTLLTLPAAADYTFIKFKDANTGYVAGNSTGVICKTTNGGANWTFQHTHNITLTKVYVNSGDTAWALGGNEAIFRNSGSPSQIKLDLGVSMEGMLNPVTNQMSRNDTVKVYLRNGSAPYAIVDSASAVINAATLQGSYSFANASSGVYYVEAKYWNCVETWSKNPVPLKADGTITNYDFTTANTQAYGNNEVMVGTKWCNFSGDVNNSGGVDFTDVIAISNDVTSFVSGYVATDLNGDNVVNFTDQIFGYNNSTMFVIAKHP